MAFELLFTHQANADMDELKACPRKNA